ncbi:hypothetical protein [uncultured Thiothrix sp.]|uniref:hypothetical protein n=1 Tax=uncultured Thiothrix sp. TaxID=223185 RepID=UPI002616353F|nr:hypothetical protein [uncultured Thiothrix sp.]HMT93421.1 hypothetical protein [Thiolinea sp.]
MKLVNKSVAASAVVLSSLLSFSVVYAATAPEAVPAPAAEAAEIFAGSASAPPPVESLISPPQAAAEKARGQKGGVAVSAEADGLQLTTGWYRVQQTYRFLGDSSTWAYLEGPNAWILCNDNECEQMLIAAAESSHWLYVNMTSASTFNAVRLYKY